MGEANRRKNLGMMPQGIRPGQQFQVDLENTTQKKCDECGGELFIPAVTVHIVSAIVSPIGQELIAQQPVLVCMACRKPLIPIGIANAQNL
jgi:hypothetical protein